MTSSTDDPLFKRCENIALEYAQADARGLAHPCAYSREREIAESVLARRARLSPSVPDGKWLVWSNEHGAWWGANRSGYYTDINSAGRYSIEDAASCARVRSRNKDEVPPELVVPSPELIQSLLAQPPSAHPEAGKVQEPYGYVWFTRNMEQRFTKQRPDEDRAVNEIKPVYAEPQGTEAVVIALREMVDDATEVATNSYTAGHDLTDDEWREADPEGFAIVARARSALLRHPAPTAGSDVEVYCHPCSVAGGAGRAIYHLPPQCPTPKPAQEER